MIYAIIQGSRYIKFGYTNNVEKRLQILQTGNPQKIKLLAYCEGTQKHEAHIRDNDSVEHARAREMAWIHVQSQQYDRKAAQQ